MEFYSTRLYDKWFYRINDKVAKAKIYSRLRRIKIHGNYGDCEKVSKDISELRIDYGPGYRIYLTKKEAKLIVLLVGGDKSTQSRDVKKAVKMAADTTIEELTKWY